MLLLTFMLPIHPYTVSGYPDEVVEEATPAKFPLDTPTIALLLPEAEVLLHLLIPRDKRF